MSNINTINENNNFPTNWFVLDKPMEDLHSIVYHSKMVISSGDSMAREASILGVPTIYVGDRDMKANQIMIDKGMLIKNSDETVHILVDRIINGKIGFPKQELFLSSLDEEWIDLVEFINHIILDYNKENLN